jgi:hypothetical protein
LQRALLPTCPAHDSPLTVLPAADAPCSPFLKPLRTLMRSSNWFMCSADSTSQATFSCKNAARARVEPSGPWSESGDLSAVGSFADPSAKRARVNAERGGGAA